MISAGQAIARALHALGARRIAIASPYGPALTAAAVSYWEQHGLTITRVEPIAEDRGAFHPIYAHSADHAATATTRLLDAPEGAEAIVLLGTGLPTLPALVQAADAALGAVLEPLPRLGALPRRHRHPGRRRQPAPLAPGRALAPPAGRRPAAARCSLAQRSAPETRPARVSQPTR